MTAPLGPATSVRCPSDEGAGLLPWGFHSDRAACLGFTGDAFFVPDPGHEARAKAICWTCPVREPCLAYAVATDQRLGVWGGLNPAERRALIRQFAADAGFEEGVRG